MVIIPLFRHTYIGCVCPTSFIIDTMKKKPCDSVYPLIPCPTIETLLTMQNEEREQEENHPRTFYFLFSDANCEANARRWSADLIVRFNRNNSTTFICSGRLRIDIFLQKCHSSSRDRL